MIGTITLVLLAIMIPLVMAIFWSRTAKMMDIGTTDKNGSLTVLDGNFSFNLFKWIYQHRTKLNVIIAVIVTVMEFFAMFPL